MIIFHSNISTCTPTCTVSCLKIEHVLVFLNFSAKKLFKTYLKFKAFRQA